MLGFRGGNKPKLMKCVRTWDLDGISDFLGVSSCTYLHVLRVAGRMHAHCRVLFQGITTPAYWVPTAMPTPVIGQTLQDPGSWCDEFQKRIVKNYRYRPDSEFIEPVHSGIILRD